MVVEDENLNKLQVREVKSRPRDLTDDKARSSIFFFFPLQTIILFVIFLTSLGAQYYAVPQHLRGKISLFYSLLWSKLGRVLSVQ